MKQGLELIRTVTVFTQLGISLITPPVVMALLGWWLQKQFGFGVWVMVVCLFLGLMSAGAGALTSYRRLMRRMERKDRDRNKPIRFFRHE